MFGGVVSKVREFLFVFPYAFLALGTLYTSYILLCVLLVDFFKINVITLCVCVCVCEREREREFLRPLWAFRIHFISGLSLNIY